MEKFQFARKNVAGTSINGDKAVRLLRRSFQFPLFFIIAYGGKFQCQISECH